MVATAPPRRTVTDPPNTNGQKPESKDEKRFSTASDLISYAQMPLAMRALIHERQHPGEISPWALDVYTVEAHKASIAGATVQLANEYPVLGAVLDKMSVGGPIMGFFVAVLSASAQCIENHGALPELARSIIPGVVDRQEIAQQITKDIQEKQDATATSNPSS